MINFKQILIRAVLCALLLSNPVGMAAQFGDLPEEVVARISQIADSNSLFDLLALANTNRQCFGAIHQNKGFMLNLRKGRPAIQDVSADYHRKITPEFAALGKMYLITDPRPPQDTRGRVRPFVLSGVAPHEMTLREAEGWDDHEGHHPGYCEKMGARLPTEHEYDALGRAMRPGGKHNGLWYEDGKYNVDTIADMYVRTLVEAELFQHEETAFRTFWLVKDSSYPRLEFFFKGSLGYVDGATSSDLSMRSVRCVL